jgi:hypothetical protein
MDEGQVVSEIGYGRFRELLEGNSGMEVTGYVSAVLSAKTRLPLSLQTIKTFLDATWDAGG